MNQKEMIRFVKSVVIRFLNGRPHLEIHRQDLEQEGCLAFLRQEPKWVPGKGSTKNEWLFHSVWQGLQKYIDRREKPHWPKGPGLTDLDRVELRTLRDHKDQDKGRLKELEELEYREYGPVWDLEEVPDVDEIPVEEPREMPRLKLMEAMVGVKLTDREQEFLEYFLELNEIVLVAEAMSITKQRGHQYLNAIIQKAKVANGT